MQVNLEEAVRLGTLSGMHTEMIAQAIVGGGAQVIVWWTEHPEVPIDTAVKIMMRHTLLGLVGQPRPVRDQ